MGRRAHRCGSCLGRDQSGPYALRRGSGPSAAARRGPIDRAHRDERSNVAFLFPVYFVNVHKQSLWCWYNKTQARPQLVGNETIEETWVSLYQSRVRLCGISYILITVNTARPLHSLLSCNVQRNSRILPIDHLLSLASHSARSGGHHESES